MNKYSIEDEPLPESYRYCDYVERSGDFEWYCIAPLHADNNHYVVRTVCSA